MAKKNDFKAITSQTTEIYQEVRMAGNHFFKIRLQLSLMCTIHKVSNN